MRSLSQCARIALAYCFVFLCVCDNPAGPSHGPNYVEGNTYIGGDIGMRISFPGGWAVSADTIVNNYSFRMLARKLTFVQFQPNVSLVWTDHGGTTNLNEMLDTIEQQLLGSLQGAAIVSKQIVQVDANDFGEMVFDFTYSNIVLREKQLYFIHESKDIIVTFADLKANYSGNEADFNSIQASIEVQ